MKIPIRPVMPMKRRGALLVCALSLFPPQASLLAELPSGAQVTHGDLNFSQNGNSLDINQLSPQGIANWESFSIGADNTVNINQPNSQSVLMNRVQGARPSELLGRLNSNGRVFLVNPNGIVVGRGASINTAEFIASALDVSDQDFLNGGDLTFSGGSDKSVINLGSITATNGDAFLLAYRVANDGSISAPNGVAGLASGSEIVLSPEGDQRLFVKTGITVPGGGSGVKNSGVIEAAQAELNAAGGNIYEMAVNQTGMIRATGTTVKNGRVLLTADGGTVGVSGEIAARNSDGSGGEVLVGGGERGENTAVPNAARTVVTVEAVIDVSASAPSGNAGRAIVWADESTRFLGTILGQGGSAGGDGAFAEVSGKRFLDYQGVADLRAASGRSGQLLLDPASLTIRAAADANLALSGVDPFEFGQDTSTASSILSVATLQNQLAISNVILDTSVVQDFNVVDGSIVIEDAVAWTSGNTLSFHSGNNIDIQADLDAGSGNIEFGLGFVADAFGNPATTANLTVDAAAAVTANQVTIRRNSDAVVFGANAIGGSMGNIDFRGALNAATLDIQYARSGFVFTGADGIAGSVRIDNANNRIGTLASTVSTGEIGGAFTVVDGGGGLVVEGDFVDIAGATSIVTTGNLTLAPGSSLATRDGHDIYLAAQGGAFLNNAGAGAVAPGGAGRYLIYSDNPADTVKGGLTGSPVYDKTYAANAPGTITQTGNRFLYGLAPTLTLTADSLSKTTGAPNPAFSFSVSGLVGDDAAVDVFTGAPSLSTVADTSSPAGNYAIDIANGTVTLSDYGYGLNLVPGILTIDPAALARLTITANDFTRTFGDANPDFTARFSGFLPGDDSGIVTGLGFTTTAQPESSIGNYTITPFGASAAGYEIAYQPGTLRIDPRSLTIRGPNLTHTFGDALPVYMPTFENLAPFDQPSAIPNVVVSGPTSTLTDVGINTLFVTSGTNPNYTITPVNGSLETTRRPATLNVGNATREYGLANPDFGFSVTNQVAGAPIFSQISFGSGFTSAAIGANVGSYAITPFNLNPNYDVTVTAGTLAVTPAPATLAADSFSRQYGLANPAFTFAAPALRAGDTLAGVLDNITLGTTAVEGTGVGNVPINISADVLSSNYDFNFVPGTLNINKAPLLVTPALSSRLYGDANPTSYGLVGSGLRAGDSIDVVSGAIFQNLTPLNANVGTTGTVSILGANALNYDLSFGTGTMNIFARPLTITANSFTREYGDANPAFTAAFDNLASFDDESVIPNLRFTTPGTQAANVLAGGYGINVSSDLNPNYAITYLPGTLNITPAPLLVELGHTSRFFGDSDIIPTASVATGFKLGQTIDDLNLRVVTSTTPSTDVGVYGYNATSTNPNYTLNITGGLLTINPAPIDVIINNASRNYGDLSPTPDIFNIGGLKFLADFADIVQVTDPTDRTTGVGLYDFGATVLSPNYTLNSVAGSISVVPRPLDLVGSGTRIFGELNPPGSAFTITGSFVNGDLAADVVSLTYNSPLTPLQDVGTYDITADTTFGLRSGNYRINSASNSLTITPRPIRIEVESQDRLYGEENPAFSFLGETNIQPSINSPEEVFRFTTEADRFTDPGSYPVGAEIINPNYTLGELITGNLGISPREISIDIRNASRFYGDSNPAFQADYGLDGLPDFVDAATSLNYVTLNADERSNVGSYLISLVDGELNSARYTLRGVTPGQLTVNPRPVTLELDSQQIFYGDDGLVTATVTGGSLAPFDRLDDLLLPLAEGLDAGNYRLNDFTNNPNYVLTEGPNSGQLSVIPRPLTVSADSFARFYGDPNPAFTATFGGAGLNDFLRNTGLFNVTTVQPTGIQSNAGFYLINLPDETLNNPNLNFTGVTPGVLSVLPRPITIDVADLNLVLDFGSSLGLGDFDSSGLSYRAVINNVPAFVDLEAIARGLTFQVTEANSFTPVEVIPPSEFTAPDLSIFEGRGNFVSVADAGIPTSRLATSGRSGASTAASSQTTEIIPVQIGDSGSGSEVIPGEIEPIDPELSTIPVSTSTPGSVTRSYFITLSDGAGGNQNLVLTLVNPGILNLRARTNIEQISFELDRAVETAAKSEESLVIRSSSDYQNNVGLIFSDFPDMTVDMIVSYFEDLFATQGASFDEDSLFFSIFGKTFGTREDIDPKVIRSWLADISTNIDKRSRMTDVLVGYMGKLQAIDWKDRSPGQRVLATAVAANYQKARDASAKRLIERKEEFDRNSLAAMSYYELKEDIGVLKGRTAVVAQGFMDDKRGSNGYTQAELAVLEELIATSGDVRDAARTIELLDAWIAERSAAGRKREFVDDQIEGLRKELQEIQTKRNELRAILEDESRSGYRIADSGLEAAFGNYTPYGDFLSEVRLDTLDAKLAKYDIIGSALGSGASPPAGESSLGGAVVAGGAGSAVGLVTTPHSVGKFIAPYALRAADAGKAISGGGRLAGPIGVALTAVITITDRAFQTFQEDEQRIIFEGLTEDFGKPVNFDDIDVSAPVNLSDPDFNPTPEEMKAIIQKEYLGDALSSMLLGL